MPDASDPDVRARLRAAMQQSRAERDALVKRAATGDAAALAILENERAKLDLAQPGSRLTATEAAVRRLTRPTPELKRIDVEALAKRWAEATKPPPPTFRQRLWKWSKLAASVTGWVLAALAALHGLGVI